ncbi:polysaccharide deacteylase family 2 protein [uncultured Tateyamaria sp.]|uniref:polysaccharide deacteylase family 2 protein n=1 Tax=uncultured Tateyamaria sp. TaxID=455651 RepID=UPI002635112B|nr:polysaccharide deacteylase family 2 protein [uncultured Tateyamaria sp.]
MARGFLSGIVLGGVVSVVGAGVLSVVADGPVSPDADVRAPAASEAPEADAATTATAEADEGLTRDTSTAPAVEAPETGDADAVQAADADAPALPETGAAPQADAGDTTDTDAQVAIADVDPVAPVAPADAPTQPATGTAPAISEDPSLPAPPTASEVTDDAAPETGEAPATPAPEAAVPDTSTAGPAPAPAEPEVPDAPSEDGTVPPLPEVAATEPETEDATQGRPTIGTPAVSLVDRTPDVPVTATPEAESTDADAPPIVAYAAGFDNPDDKPLMSIVLIDSGIDLSGGPVGLAALQSFPYPLTFAVDASLTDAGARTADYRAQGFEVMALVDLPQGATASDAEVALSAALDAVPQAVAVMEGPGTGIQDTRDASDQVTEAILASGHGLVLQSKGLNTAQKLAARAGVPTGLVFRDFDSADQTPSVIRRFLDQAAFRAGQEGGVIMVGRVRPDTISALLLWGLQDRAERVALAPVSAVLTTLSADR